MKDTDFSKMIKFKVTNGHLIPVDYKGFDFTLKEDNNETYLIPAQNRDLKLMAVYHIFTQWLWDQMPLAFQKERCPERSLMYVYLKLIEGRSRTSLKYKDIESVIVPSIAFGNMSETEFKEYVNNQIIEFYEKCLIPLNMEYLLDEANKEFSRLFSELI